MRGEKITDHLHTARVSRITPAFTARIKHEHVHRLGLRQPIRLDELLRVRAKFGVVQERVCERTLLRLVPRTRPARFSPNR